MKGGGMKKRVFETGRQAVEALPASIRVGPFDFGIEKLSAQRAMGRDYFGEFSPCEGRLALQLDMPSAVKAADTLLHEAGHAIYWTYGLADEDTEERVVGIFATAWAQVFRDNPWLLEWIGSALLLARGRAPDRGRGRAPDRRRGQAPDRGRWRA
jgi:hypothetical protein